MVRLFLKQRFTKLLIDKKTVNKTSNLIGPYKNYIGAKTINFLQLRLSGEDYSGLRIVNNHYKKQDNETNEFIKSFFRTFSDTIITNVNKTY